MEKLIELLNEHLKTFDTETNKTNKVYAFENATKSFIAENGTSYRQERVISKRFKFIKWLVDNDKIDTILFANELNKVVYLADFNFRNDMGFYKIIYYQLLMLLSIQDEPIEYLLSILK